MRYIMTLVGVWVGLSKSLWADDAHELILKAQTFAFKNQKAGVDEFIESLAKGQKCQTVPVNPPDNKGALLPHKGKRCQGDTASSGKCASTLLQVSPSQEQSPSQLLVFISQSMPDSCIKQLWGQVHKVGGKIVLRGLIGNSFKDTQSYIQQLGIIADIDPNLFETFSIREVPTFILVSQNRHDRMVGNVSLTAFLEQASTSGDLKHQAHQLLKRLQRER